MPEVEERIETIQFVFRETQARGWDEQVGIKDFSHPEFHSIAIEAMSELIASEEIGNGATDFRAWMKFFDTHRNRFQSQLYTGLGWALAKNGQPYNLFPAPHALAEAKILDGYGYYYGLFRGRLVIRSQQIPALIPEGVLPYFDAGLGRALWYQSKGDLSKLTELLSLFPESRRAALWSGIGLASCFVGGLTIDEIHNLLNLAGNHQSSFQIGVRAAIESREKSGIQTHSEELFASIA
jgi:hypothetical protein